MCFKLVLAGKVLAAAQTEDGMRMDPGDVFSEMEALLVQVPKRMSGNHQPYLMRWISSQPGPEHALRLVCFHGSRL